MTGYKHPDEDGNTARPRVPWRPPWHIDSPASPKVSPVRFEDIEVDFRPEDVRLIEEACERFNVTPELWVDVSFRVGMAELEDDDTWMPDYLNHRPGVNRYDSLRRWCHWWRDRH